MTIKPNKFYNLTNHAYHYGIGRNWLSKSRLSLLVPPSTPRAFRYAEDHPEELDIFDKASEKFNKGTAFHTYFLEPDKFTDQVVITPTFSGKGSRTEREAWKEGIRRSERVPISQADMDDIRSCDEVLKSGLYETAREIIYNPDNFTEKSGFWIDEATGLKLKCRPDIIAPGSVVWDLKTFSGRPHLFSTQAISLGYDLQAYMTLRGITAITGVPHTQFGFIIFHLSTTPIEIEVRLADDLFLLSGQEKFNKALATYLQCSQTGLWPGIPDTIQPLSPPVWRGRELEKIYFD